MIITDGAIFERLSFFPYDFWSNETFSFHSIRDDACKYIRDTDGRFYWTDYSLNSCTKDKLNVWETLTLHIRGKAIFKPFLRKKKTASVTYAFGKYGNILMSSNPLNSKA